MNCEKIKDMILEGYLDKETGSEERGLIERHLAECNSCREFVSVVTKSAIEPFKKAEIHKVPDSIWHRIKEAIESERQPDARPSSTPNLIATLKNIFYIPKPVLVAASLIIMAAFLGLFTKKDRD